MRNEIEKENALKLFNLDSEYTLEQLKKSWRKKITERHPDVNLGDDSATADAQEINAAYDILLSELKRRSNIFSQPISRINIIRDNLISKLKNNIPVIESEYKMDIQKIVNDFILEVKNINNIEEIEKLYNIYQRKIISFAKKYKEIAFIENKIESKYNFDIINNMLASDIYYKVNQIIKDDKQEKLNLINKSYSDYAKEFSKNEIFLKVIELLKRKCIDFFYEKPRSVNDIENKITSDYNKLLDEKNKFYEKNNKLNSLEILIKKYGIVVLNNEIDELKELILDDNKFKERFNDLFKKLNLLSKKYNTNEIDINDLYSYVQKNIKKRYINIINKYDLSSNEIIKYNDIFRSVTNVCNILKSQYLTANSLLILDKLFTGETLDESKKIVAYLSGDLKNCDNTINPDLLVVYDYNMPQGSCKYLSIENDEVYLNSYEKNEIKKINMNNYPKIHFTTFSKFCLNSRLKNEYTVIFGEKQLICLSNNDLVLIKNNDGKYIFELNFIYNSLPSKKSEDEFFSLNEFYLQAQKIVRQNTLNYFLNISDIFDNSQNKKK